MAKFKKGSKEAKMYMAKLRAKRKKLSGTKETAKIKKVAASLKVRMPHGYETASGKVRKPKKATINGMQNDNLNEIKNLYMKIYKHNNLIEAYTLRLKSKAPMPTEIKKMYKQQIILAKKYIAADKKRIIQLKKLI
jgi:hypothetical protein